MRKEETKARKKTGMESKQAGKKGGKDRESKKTNENFPPLTKARNGEGGGQEVLMLCHSDCVSGEQNDVGSLHQATTRPSLT